MTDKASFLLGKLQPYLEKQLQSNEKYLKILEQQRERLASGGVWHDPQKNIDDISKIITYKLQDNIFLIEILNEICRAYSICSTDADLIEYIKSKPKLYAKLEELKNNEIKNEV